jgi:hypothetical protein
LATAAASDNVSAVLNESQVHDVTITKEVPNYRRD